MTYKSAGVDIEKGDRFASFISNFKSRFVDVSGGFAGGIEIDLSRFKKPVLMSCTDGVGTKLLVAQQLGKFDTVGIDLVAMSVNDLIVCGAEPMSFLDYIACGQINEEFLHQIISGVINGCEQAECVLSGGETAEMPDLYKDNDFDLAGFCVGLAEKEYLLPKKDLIHKEDILFGLPSVGIHSNGFSLARKVIAPDHPVYPSLLTPTKIYVKEMKKLLATGKILAAAHITGGGLEANTQRVLPGRLKVKLYPGREIPEPFVSIQKEGNISDEEMGRVFNMGVGISIVVSARNADSFAADAAALGIALMRIGEIDG
ncbi:MAG: phosphoribosylformylglycinamidine cyclo-ligase [Spirochaetales bacterium]|nr:phosphoribosylformylglycinamidine cyclo-ligase [Spirochaetales bacterium]